MSSLELPKTTRFAEKSEVPRAYWEKIAARQEVHFIEGYVLTDVKDSEQLFRFYAEVNVNNSRLWELLLNLTSMLPDVCACLFCPYEGDVTYGEYQDKKLILTVLGSLQKELTADCRLEFGLIYNDDDTLVEVYVAESKFIKVWGIDQPHFEQIMKQYGIPRFEEMRFVDEFPKVVVPLTTLDAEAKTTEEVLDLLGETFSE
ncbi:hypothetical protein J0X19_22705 [Hymenobacter sp. BT186]|uniref:Uncharacterized protein n=1 Tax=Hymenobacter telluris TaxID=2816474 RepID=A0A939F3M6_9BACT|nr:hypothetical protein [Hymenobacter telluris]MBO0360788.1 hypothetical protein [Hymenobacter telluris]MBW3376816.1 hypothetical protein [Hymenobacter norwichensis]